MAKALPLIEVTHPSFMIIDGSLRDQLSALVRLQDDTGLWHTILDDPDSYLEVSASAGIGSALLSSGKLYTKYVQKSLCRHFRCGGRGRTGQQGIGWDSRHEKCRRIQTGALQTNTRMGTGTCADVSC